jgi:hypothetical protein
MPPVSYEDDTSPPLREAIGSPKRRPTDRKFNRPVARHPVTIQVRRGVFFACSLRERLELGKEKPRFAVSFFFAGRTARSGRVPCYAVRNNDLGAGEPLTLAGTSTWCAT